MLLIYSRIAQYSKSKFFKLGIDKSQNGCYNDNHKATANRLKDCQHFIRLNNTNQNFLNWVLTNAKQFDIIIAIVTSKVTSL